MELGNLFIEIIGRAHEGSHVYVFCSGHVAFFSEFPGSFFPPPLTYFLFTWASMSMVDGREAPGLDPQPT
jgi:hypothetical protein